MLRVEIEARELFGGRGVEGLSHSQRVLRRHAGDAHAHDTSNWKTTTIFDMRSVKNGRVLHPQVQSVGRTGDGVRPDVEAVRGPVDRNLRRVRPRAPDDAPGTPRAPRTKRRRRRR